MAPLVKTFLDNKPPYGASIEIKNTMLWKKYATDFKIHISDSNGRAGNVTIHPSMDECEKAIKTENSFEMVT